MAVFFPWVMDISNTPRDNNPEELKNVNTKEFGDFNVKFNLGNRYRSGDFNAPSNSIFFETETFKVIFKDSGTEVIFFVSISSSSIVRLTNDIHDHVLCYCQHHLFKGVVFDHIFLELVGNLTLLTKYLIEKRDDALDNNYCSTVFF